MILQPHFQCLTAATPTSAPPRLFWTIFPKDSASRCLTESMTLGSSSTSSETSVVLRHNEASRGGMRALESKLNAIFALIAFLVRGKARFTMDYLVLSISSGALISIACYFLVFHFSLLHYSLPFFLLYSSVPSLLYSALRKPSTFKFD